MDIPSFYWHAAAAALMGTAIGLERQWGQHTAGLRTNALVAFGACLYVSLPGLIGGSPTAAQLAGQVVTGIGFLGGGVILKEGLTNIRGLNTAATMWCSAAVGSLAGAGLMLEGLAGAAGVLAMNLILKPVSDWLDRRLRHTKHVQTTYQVRVTCPVGREAEVRAVVLAFFHDHPTMVIQGIATKEGEELGRACVVVDIFSEQQDDGTMEDLKVRLRGEVGAPSVRWVKNPSR